MVSKGTRRASAPKQPGRHRPEPWSEPCRPRWQAWGRGEPRYGLSWLRLSARPLLGPPALPGNETQRKEEPMFPETPLGTPWSLGREKGLKCPYTPPPSAVATPDTEPGLMQPREMRHPGPQTGEQPSYTWPRVDSQGVLAAPQGSVEAVGGEGGRRAVGDTQVKQFLRRGGHRWPHQPPEGPGPGPLTGAT